jgi:Peptidase A4 family
MSDYASASDALGRYRTYDPPPRDLDLRRASTRTLRRHGLPPRPDPRSEPELARIWESAGARDPKYVKAELAIDPALRRRDPRLRRDAGDDFDQANWGGAFVQDTAAKFVFAEWVVPHVSAFDPALFAEITGGFWVGIDGIAFEQGGDQLLQAGVRVDVRNLPPPFDSTLGVRWRAWTEWWSVEYVDTDAAGPVAVTNFPVSSGDTVSFLVCAEQPDFGYVWIANSSTGQHTSVGVPALPHIASVGTTVEWIVEAPSNSPDLPMFSPVTFTSCVGGSLGSHVLDVSHGIIVDIDRGNGPITRASIPSDTSVAVEWLGWS